MNRRAFLQLRTSGSPLGIAAGLEPYEAALDRRRAAHLLRRTGFGADAAALQALLGRPGHEAAADLVDAAVSVPAPAPPAWAGEPFPAVRDRAYRDENRRRLEACLTDWVVRLQTGGLRERMTLFWSNHFVTSYQRYGHAPFAHQYLTTLHAHALGDFRTFVHAVGLTPAMLLYLDGVTNVRTGPNENYARELLELFTMGRTDAAGDPLYDDPEDVADVARALTGWIVDPQAVAALFVPSRHDDGTKTIFGRTGRFGYDDVVDLIFAERADAVARHVCRELYRAFVYDVPDETIVAGLAEQLVAEEFALAPVVRTLLASAHFFDAQGIGAQMKSPVAFVVGLVNEGGVTLPPGTHGLLALAAAQLGQRLLDPPDVSGWPGHHAWITTTTLPLRWSLAEYLTVGNIVGAGIDLRPLAEALTDPAWSAGADLLDAFYLPVAIAEHFLPVPLEEAGIEPVEEEFAGDLINTPIPAEIEAAPAYVRDLAKIFLAGTHWYEWSPNSTAAPRLLLDFVRYLVQRPEYQLA